MKFQDSSFNCLKVTVGTKSVTHPRTHARSKSNMPHQLFQSWGHNYLVIFFFHLPTVLGFWQSADGQPISRPISYLNDSHIIDR